MAVSGVPCWKLKSKFAVEHIKIARQSADNNPMKSLRSNSALVPLLVSRDLPLLNNRRRRVWIGLSI